ncbi:hypothetical protein CXT94_03780 [Akkermansia muciniphila]|nr:hypothetical protein CXT94_03780 [Akkermansia muciniphila]
MKDVADASPRLKGGARIPPVYDSSSGCGKGRVFRRGGRTGSSCRRGAVSGAGKAADAWPDMAPGWERGEGGDEKRPFPRKGSGLEILPGGLLTC